MIFQIASNLLLTILLEVLFLMAVTKKNKIIDILFFAFINIFTNLFGQGLFVFVAYNFLNYLLIEIAIFIIESLLLFIFYKQSRYILFAFIANFLTATIGFLISKTITFDIDFLPSFIGILSTFIYILIKKMVSIK